MQEPVASVVDEDPHGPARILRAGDGEREPLGIREVDIHDLDLHPVLRTEPAGRGFKAFAVAGDQDQIVSLGRELAGEFGP
ncbi:hypothetical protein GCM10009849_22420 [Sinomonas flava]|uniref:Uncharacterized protein n=1 Tax=Sinomonas flava TaxID=496857 RepID=A0ABP5NMH9_9MICC